MVTTKQRSTEQSEKSTKERDAGPDSGSERDQRPASEEELQGLLEQQITQAIEPVLAEFRAQMTQAVQQEMEHAFSGTIGDSSGGGRQSDGGDVESEVVEKRAPSAQQNEQPAQQREQEAGGGEDHQQESQSKSEAGKGQSLPGQITRRLQPVSSTLVQGLEHKAGDWMQSMIVAGLTAALSEASRGAIQGAAEKGLDAVLERTFDALPESANTGELRTQTQRTLHTILDDVFDAVYAEDIRKELQAHGQKTAQSLIRRDLDGALEAVKSALQTVGEEIVSVLRRQWQKVLRLLLKLIMTALDSALPGDERESLPSSSEKRGEKSAAGKR
jgi:hypothetical protein